MFLGGARDYFYIDYHYIPNTNNWHIVGIQYEEERTNQGLPTKRLEKADSVTDQTFIPTVFLTLTTSYFLEMARTGIAEMGGRPES